jgi:hypothetical protein
MKRGWDKLRVSDTATEKKQKKHTKEINIKMRVIQFSRGIFLFFIDHFSYFFGNWDCG